MPANFENSSVATGPKGQFSFQYQRNICCKDGLIKERNGMDLTEAEDIKKRWQEKLYKKDFHDPDNHNE